MLVLLVIPVENVDGSFPSWCHLHFGFPLINEDRFALEIAKRKRKPRIHHHRQVDYFRRCFEITERAGFGHAGRLGRCRTGLKQLYSDTANPLPHLDIAGFEECQHLW